MSFQFRLTVDHSETGNTSKDLIVIPFIKQVFSSPCNIDYIYITGYYMRDSKILYPTIEIHARGSSIINSHEFKSSDFSNELDTFIDPVILLSTNLSITKTIENYDEWKKLNPSQIPNQSEHNLIIRLVEEMSKMIAELKSLLQKQT